jgi:hypothetical protein
MQKKEEEETKHLKNISTKPSVVRKEEIEEDLIEIKSYHSSEEEERKRQEVKKADLPRRATTPVLKEEVKQER